MKTQRPRISESVADAGPDTTPENSVIVSGQGLPSLSFLLGQLQILTHPPPPPKPSLRKTHDRN